MELQLFKQIRAAQLRLQDFRRWVAIAAIGSFSSIIILLIQWGTSQEALADFGWLMVIMTSIALILAVVGGRSAYGSPTDVAREIEQRFPGLRQCLITAVDEVTSKPGRPRGYLQHAVIHQAVRHGSVHPWREVVPTGKMTMARIAGSLALLIVASLSANLIATGRPAIPPLPVLELNSPFASDLEVQIEPGDDEVELGTNVIVLARFPFQVPEQAALVATNDAGESRVLPMNRSLDDPLFGGHLTDVREDLSYHVEFSNQSSETYRLTVFEFPELVQADAEISFPQYTKLPDRTVTDTRRITAVEGTELSWLCHVNKPVTEARLTNHEGESIELKAEPNRPGVYRAELTLTNEQRWKVHLKDTEGRENKVPAELIAKVTPNRPPEIKLTVAQDLRVSALEELDVGATVWDDYGLNRYGVAYAIAAESEKEIVLGQDSAGKQEQQALYMVDFESLEAEPNQLLSYYFWAEDTVADDQTRRVTSDMFFAEVRHFEEIFRQGQQPQGQQAGAQGGGNQNTQQAEQLIDLQKQIISATWNILRRETKQEVSERLGDDVKLVLESQKSALQKLDELAQRVQDAESIAITHQVRLSMLEVIDLLDGPSDPPPLTVLNDAIKPEQASYQGLLRLRAREFEVIRSSQRSQSGGSGGSSSNRFQQQLQDLELEDDPQRYETQRQAQEQNEESQADRETRQILSRLQDLARRQADLNKQLRELQTALELAETEKRREEIRRQLKRLRDQQEDLLRDADELTERMQQAQNQAQLEETRRQLEETRDRLQQGTQALQGGDVSEALTSGTRAEREFEQMRDELRQQAAEQFNEEMREVRQQARDLDEKQQELSQQLREANQSPQPGLRPSSDAEEISRQLDEQGEDLDSLLNRIQQTVMDAEEAEPLLAEKLYEAHRETEQRQTRQNLRGASEFFQNGFRDQAQELESKASESIQNLREDVEDAAESVLGDEIEALRRASSELGELMRQIEREFQQQPQNQQNSDAETTEGQQGGQPRDGEQEGRQAQQDAQRESTNGNDQQPTGQQQDGQQTNGQQPSEQQQNDPQSGQQQDGQQQDGQQQSGQQQGGQQQSQQRQNGQQPSGQQSGQQPGGQQSASDAQPGQRQQRRDGGGLLQSMNDSLGGGPLTGADYRDWSDRLRDVEEILDDPDLRSRAAQIRDRARGIRLDFKRHSREPQWPLVRELIAEPMHELQQRVTEELLRRSGDRQELVPVDRDPVPDAFAERVRRYYESLGRGE